MSVCKACWDINKQITYHNSLSNRCPVCGATTNYQIPVPLAENDQLELIHVTSLDCLVTIQQLQLLKCEDKITFAYLGQNSKGSHIHI